MRGRRGASRRRKRWKRENRGEKRRGSRERRLDFKNRLRKELSSLSKETELWLIKRRPRMRYRLNRKALLKKRLLHIQEEVEEEEISNLFTKLRDKANSNYGDQRTLNKRSPRLKNKHKVTKLIRKPLPTML